MASPYFRPVIILTAILTLGQSIAWFILSLLGVLAYRCEIGPPDQVADSKFIQLLYLYFKSDSCGDLSSPVLPAHVHFSDFADLTPGHINGWMCAYLALNITYFIIALDLLFALCRYKNEEFPARVLRLWSLNTLAFLIMDFWFTIVWGLEFKSYTDFVANHQEDLQASFDWASSVPGALMAISARGFILYIVNLILYSYIVRYAYEWRILGRCCQQMQQGTSQQQLEQHYPRQTEHDMRMSPGYPHNSIPRINPHAYDNISLQPNFSRRGPISHPNAVEGVTSFNDWEGNNNVRYAEAQKDTRSLNRSRPASPQRREEEIFQGRPSVRSAFDYPNPRNFERGGKTDPKYPPTKAYGKPNDVFY